MGRAWPYAHGFASAILLKTLARKVACCV
jgi:hypothetical protein